MTFLSVVIPVYRSEELVGAMIERTLEVLDREKIDGEVVLVHDASPDQSWSVLEAWAARDSRVVAIDLRQNEGQHQAIMVGVRHSRGDWIATLDDDLQNPPTCLPALLESTQAGHDLVFGRFRRKEHAAGRRLASAIVSWLNRILYGLPAGMRVSNVRLFSSQVGESSLRHERRRNYFTGLALHAASSPANVWIDHEPRPGGASSYSLLGLLKLFGSLLFGHPVLTRMRSPALEPEDRVRTILNGARRSPS